MKAILDFETSSKANLKKTGAWRYAIDPSTEVICLSITFEDGGQTMWHPGQPFPAILNECDLEAHNAQFERAIIKHICIPRHGWPETVLPIAKWSCTMARCGYANYPLALEEAAKVLKLPIQKTKKPGVKAGYADWAIYCANDGLTELELSKVLPELPETERAIWEMDQKINETGFQIDIELCEAAVEVWKKQEIRLNEELAGLTEGRITSAGQRDRILAEFALDGFYLADLKIEAVEEALECDYPEKPHRILEIRRDLAKASAKKYAAALQSVCPDGRIRGAFQYYAATTGRWAGRGVQPHNFARPTTADTVDELAEAIKYRDPDYLTLMYGDVGTALKNGVRGIIVAKPGHKLVIGDYTGIEGVVTAAVSGEQWKLDAYKNGDDLYCLFASKALGFEVSKTIAKDPAHADHIRHRDARQDVGKPGELAFGFGGGVGAWRKFSDKFTDEEVDAFKVAWRAQNPRIAGTWKALATAWIMAYCGKESETNGCKFRKEGDTVICELPSGRPVFYRQAEMSQKEAPWSTPERPAQVPVLSCYDWKDGRWSPVELHGGLQMENVASGTSRDILARAMLLCDRNGATIVSHVHDEIVLEVPDTKEWTAERLKKILGRKPLYALNWPISASCREAYRYSKD